MLKNTCKATKVKQLLFEYGFGFVRISQDFGDCNLFVRMRLVKYYTQRWHGHVLDSSRCYHYKYFKSMLNVKQYQCINIPLKFKTALENFRYSNTTRTPKQYRYSL